MHSHQIYGKIQELTQGYKDGHLLVPGHLSNLRLVAVPPMLVLLFTLPKMWLACSHGRTFEFVLVFIWNSFTSGIPMDSTFYLCFYFNITLSERSIKFSKLVKEKVMYSSVIQQKERKVRHLLAVSHWIGTQLLFPHLLE